MGVFFSEIQEGHPYSRAFLPPFHATAERRCSNGMRLTTAATVPRVTYDFRSDDYWRSVPAWRAVTIRDFQDYRWQQQNSLKSMRDVVRVLGNSVGSSLLQDLKEGLSKTPMNVRITPYVFALIDWRNPYEDPIRRQFLPLGSQFLDDHPECMLDPLAEEADTAAPFLTHRYPDKVLFLPTSVCPVYCLFCTRSRVVGGSTPSMRKATYGSKNTRWEETFAYIRRNPEIEDVVVSGGDLFMVTPASLSHIGMELLEIPHVRRIRFATKGLSVAPMRINGHDGWTEAVAAISDHGRKLMKEVCLHTHFSTEREITKWTERAMKTLVSLGVKVRNQCVLLRGVNDEFDVMYRTLKKLSYLNIQPYLVYVHDMVPGCEHLRTTLGAAERMSKALQGTTAGFNTPRFVCDTPNGGGKREISSYERYDGELGVSAWTAPHIKPGQVFYYYDPIDQLPPSGQEIWAGCSERECRLAAFRRECEPRLMHEPPTRSTLRATW